MLEGGPQTRCASCFLRRDLCSRAPTYVDLQRSGDVASRRDELRPRLLAVRSGGKAAALKSGWRPA